MTFTTSKIARDQQKITTLHRLSKIHTELSKKFTALNPAKLTAELELVITKPVTINHPTDFILLPNLMGKPELWATSASGGSGVYDWAVTDPSIATVEGSALVKSVSVGKTMLVVSDHRNSQNRA